MYNFDALLLYKRLVPYFLRKPIFTAWLTVLASVLQTAQGLLQAFVDDITYDLLFNAQVIYLEHVINEQFPGSPDAYIENVFLAPDYYYNDIEVQPAIYLRNDSEGAAPVYLRNDEEYVATTQFIIHIDADLAGDVDAITALVELYAIAGMPYEIVFDL